ncbi:MAG: hypothetical protein HOG15_05125, partial [Anaerolineae bacterium]|nr:hypothetical protein [Anaerolineae bacterium]
MKRATFFILILALIALACDESADIAPDPTLAPVKITDAQPKGDRILAID